MPLADVPLLIASRTPPDDVRALLREAAQRIARFRRAQPLPRFVPSDFDLVYATLRTLSTAGVAPGRRFTEWGSGFGVAACLAALLGFEAQGIEIEPDLVAAARQLADHFQLPVTFVCGRFDRAAPIDSDVIFAYPWPDEERAIEELFERHAAAGAILLTYRGIDGLRVQRKTIS